VPKIEKRLAVDPHEVDSTEPAIGVAFDDERIDELRALPWHGIQSDPESLS
jgi:hypothetical protein